MLEKILNFKKPIIIFMVAVIVFIMFIGFVFGSIRGGMDYSWDKKEPHPVKSSAFGNSKKGDNSFDTISDTDVSESIQDSEVVTISSEQAEKKNKSVVSDGYISLGNKKIKAEGKYSYEDCSYGNTVCIVGTAEKNFDDQVVLMYMTLDEKITTKDEFEKSLQGMDLITGTSIEDSDISEDDKCFIYTSDLPEDAGQVSCIVEKDSSSVYSVVSRDNKKWICEIRK